MSLALEAFVKQIAESGVIAAGKLERFVPPQAHPKDAQELARELVRSKQLTKFQVQQIYLGRAKSLILGNYTILQPIGAGGMGQVFKAQHRRMERIVAIKTLPAATLKDPMAVARFQREVVAAAKLRHPNIVAADDADEAGGVHFLVMEYIEGRDLAAVVKELGPLPAAMAIGYIVQAARGLEFAHKKGVVHRDIKPANLLLDNDGTVKVLDMGLARLGTEADVGTRADLTGTGAVMGTIDFMAPEQAESAKHVDGRTDIYSLGCSLYYLLTGRAIYEGESLMARVLAHREAPIPALEGIPAPVRAAFARMVAKRPEDRFQTMTEVVAALEGSLGGADRATPAAPRRRLDSTDEEMTSLFRGLVDTQAEPSMKSMSSAATMRSHNDAGGRKKQLLLGTVGAALAGWALFAGIVSSLRTNNGTLVVEVDQPGAVVKVLNAAGKVETTALARKGHVEIPVVPGTKTIRVEKEGFVAFTSNEVVIESRGSALIPAPLKSLEAVNAAAAARAFETWKAELAAMPVEQHATAVDKRLHELNPRYSGKAAWTITRGAVTEFVLNSSRLADLSPLRALPGLTRVRIGSPTDNGGTIDISALAGMNLTSFACFAASLTGFSTLRAMPLEEFVIDGGQVSDLEPLRGMQLKHVALTNTAVSDLSPLAGMPLESLYLSTAGISDLSPLKGLRLQHLSCANNQVTDLSPLRGMPLISLVIEGSKVSDLKPIEDLRPAMFSCVNTPVTDLTPLSGMALHTLNFTPANTTRGLNIIRRMKSLETIGVYWNQRYPAKEFWERYDRGEFGKPPVESDRPR